jgi:hypothetical protein
MNKEITGKYLRQMEHIVVIYDTDVPCNGHGGDRKIFEVVTST